MAITVGSSEPSQFTVGDTVSWTRYEADYLPASGWNLVYGFIGPSRFFFATTASGVNHLATMPTTGVTAGDYAWEVKATNGTSNITVGSGVMRALPSLFTANTELDTLEAQLATAKTAYYALAQKKNASVSVDGVSYTINDAARLRDFILFLERRIEGERNKARALLGNATGSMFRIRFNQ